MSPFSARPLVFLALVVPVLALPGCHRDEATPQPQATTAQPPPPERTVDAAPQPNPTQADTEGDVVPDKAEGPAPQRQTVRLSITEALQLPGGPATRTFEVTVEMEGRTCPASLAVTAAADPNHAAGSKDAHWSLADVTLADGSTCRATAAHEVDPAKGNHALSGFDLEPVAGGGAPAEPARP